MAFNSIAFILFFFIATAIYFVTPAKYRKHVLLVLSYVFYGYYSFGLLFLLIGITLVNYVFTWEDIRSLFKNQKVWLAITVCLNVALLFFYKYLNFSISIFQGIASIFGASPEPYRISILAPLGISFITFQVISYLVDVYRNTIEPEKDFIKFALYLGFFPKIAQGPIVKPKDLIPQFDEEHTFSIKRFREGMLLAIFGLFMKMVIADRIGIMVDTIYSDPDKYGGMALVIATIGFAIQLYSDFAGYSLTAIGTAKVLGFEIKRNFRQPYLSTSVSEFWTRWHMSLNVWLKDYVYIPLGGSRVSSMRAKINTLLTFGLSGLWHGASGGYIIWGLLNGIYVVLGRMWRTFSEKTGIRLLPEKMDGAALSNALKRIVTFIAICFSWIFFRAQTLAASTNIIKNIFTAWNAQGFMDEIEAGLESGWEGSAFGIEFPHYIVLFICLAILIVVDVIQSKRDDVAVKVANINLIIRWIVFYLLIFAIILFGTYGFAYSAGAFLYAQY